MLLAPHQQRERRSISACPIVNGSGACGAHDQAAMLARPPDELHECRPDEALRKDRAHTCAHCGGIIGVSGLTEQDDPTSACGVTCAQDRAKVARVLRFVERNPTEFVARLEVCEARPALTHDRCKTLRALLQRDAPEGVGA